MEDVRDAIQKLYSTGRFSDVSIDATEADANAMDRAWRCGSPRN